MSWNQLPATTRQELTRRLTPRQFSCYVLWLAGCSYERTAGMLDLSTRTVRTHITRARQIHRQIEQDQENAA